ncbi:hypothetical protein GCM10009664_57290 [Kitasatospora gansuensis]
MDRCQVRPWWTVVALPAVWPVQVRWDFQGTAGSPSVRYGRWDAGRYRRASAGARARVGVAA